MATAKSKGIALTFTKLRETKGTHVFNEDDNGEVAVGTLYVKKAAAAELGNPENITVTIKAE